ncbi:LysM peptidoglycan-binding domain-containing protein [Chryseobacterium sp. MMS23-Vi53]|uniref:LysM peptidoglycan-binding domain-containing protein n=1 Tax=Chryseobacterium sp. MMS23-Vi53 TaxID=3386644 RepID=UPI0039E85F49
MRFYLQSHIVKKGETLEQIANHYQISDIELLKYFHHLHVPRDKNHISSTLFEGQEIFIPDQKDIEEILDRRKQNVNNRKNQANLSIQNGLLLPNFSQINHTYKVLIKDLIDEQIQNETEFDISIKYLGQENGLYLFQFIKESVLLNGKTPDLKTYELAAECSSLFSNIEFEINSHGKVENIKNYYKILPNWKRSRDQLLKKYDDENSIQYIDEFDKTVEIKELFLEYFRQDLFLQFYFSPYFKTYSKSEFENSERFSSYDILYRNHYLIDVSESIEITQTSDCIDERTQQKIINQFNDNNENNEDELLESKITATYHLNKEKKLLQKANIKMELQLYIAKEITEIQIDIK